MSELELSAAQSIVTASLAFGSRSKLKPLAVAVLDARGALKAFAASDGCSLGRGKIAHAKAYGALSLGVGSRALFNRAQEQPSFIAAVGALFGGELIPVPGGVLIRDTAGDLLGAVGISGDTSDNDEAAALARIAHVGLTGDPG